MNSIFQIPVELSDFSFNDQEKIFLVAGKPNQEDSVLGNDLCLQLKDCGFNSVAATINQNHISDSLLNCHLSGLKLFIRNIRLLDMTSSFVNSYKNVKGLGGWLLDYMLTPESDRKNSAVEYANSLIQDPEHPVFIGLYGDWEWDFGYDKKEVPTNFTQYLAEFQHLFKPSLWPYFYFPDLIKAGGGIGILSFPLERQIMFYKSLQYFAYISRYTTSPFWVSCRCQSFNNISGLSGPTLDVRRMRGIVFSSLAHGAQGIYYWNYRQNEPTSETTYSNAPVDLDGNQTNTWGMVKTINEEVTAFNDVFCRCEMIDCRHFNAEGMRWIKQLSNYAMGPLISVKQTAGNKTKLMISHIFSHKTKKNYLVMVANPFASMFIINTVKFQFNFSQYWNVKSVVKNGSGYTETAISNYSPTVTMNYGDYLIYTWD